MKRKLIFLIIAASVMLGSSIIIILLKNTNKDNYNSNDYDDLIITKIYSNYAYGTSFSGTAIYSDGTIYTWIYPNKSKETYSDYIDNNNVNTKEGLEQFLKSKGIKSNRKLPEEELSRLKTYLNKINDNNKSKELCLGADRGNLSIIAYRGNKEILIEASGDCEQHSNDKNAKEVLTIIEKYL